MGKFFAGKIFPSPVFGEKFQVPGFVPPPLTQRGLTWPALALVGLRRFLWATGPPEFWQRLDVHKSSRATQRCGRSTSQKKRSIAFPEPGASTAPQRAFDGLLDQLQTTELPELKTLRRTLVRWRNEILAYFDTGLTNAITEGFNLKAKLVKRRGFGYRSFRNYRLRLLNACAS